MYLFTCSPQHLLPAYLFGRNIYGLPFWSRVYFPFWIFLIWFPFRRSVVTFFSLFSFARSFFPLLLSVLFFPLIICFSSPLFFFFPLSLSPSFPSFSYLIYSKVEILSYVLCSTVKSTYLLYIWYHNPMLVQTLKNNLFFCLFLRYTYLFPPMTLVYITLTSISSASRVLDCIWDTVLNIPVYLTFFFPNFPLRYRVFDSAYHSPLSSLQLCILSLFSANFFIVIWL